MINRRLLLAAGVAAQFSLSRSHSAAAQALGPLIMLDPGHGGKDPGAIGAAGTYEKHITLAAAQELRTQLMRSGRFRVEFTRLDDNFIPLADRVDFAQQRGAALFVSMHADALLDRAVRGASVYTLGEHATDAQTAALAARENASDRFAGQSFRDTPPEVAKILTSLVRHETRTESARLAHNVVRSLGQATPLLTNPDRQAGFAVLKAADIPSVLVEMGFLSNPLDEQALGQAAHRARVAAAMKLAIEGYFKTLPNASLG